MRHVLLPLCKFVSDTCAKLLKVSNLHPNKVGLNISNLGILMRGAFSWHALPKPQMEPNLSISQDILNAKNSSGNNELDEPQSLDPDENLEDGDDGQNARIVNKKFR